MIKSDIKFNCINKKLDVMGCGLTMKNKKTMISTKRDTNLEFLRIISMIMIVISHWNYHSGIDLIEINNSFNKILLGNSWLGNLGVIIFFMITGYFSCKSDKGINIKKIMKIILQVFTYSVGIYVFLLLIGKVNFSIKDCVKVLFPIASKKYWFVTVYIVLVLLIPFINILIKNITKKEFKKLMVVLTILFSIIPTFTSCDFYGNELIQGIYFYLLGAYINVNNPDFINKNCKFIFLASVILLIGSTICIDLLGNYISVFSTHIWHFYSRHSLLSISVCVSLFVIFRNLRLKENKFVNFVAAHTFAVYLISDNNYIRRILWHDIFRVSDYAESPFLILNLVISVTLVFVVCISIELIRKKTIEKITDKLIDKFIIKKQCK